MKAKMSFYLSILILLAVTSLGWAQFQSNTFETYTGVGITESDKVTLLQGNTKSGDLIQLFWVGPNGSIDNPDSLGHMAADDSLLGVTHIGYGYPFNANQGLFAAFFRHELLVPGTTVYIRAWNDSVITSRTAYGNSLSYTINSDFDSHDFGLDFVPPQSWLMNAGPFDEPVELALFTASDEAGHVLLRWTTFSETNNLGFNLYRASSWDSSRSRLNEQLIEGAGNSQAEHQYLFRDHQVNGEQKYFYWLSDVSISGVELLHGPITLTTQSAPDNFTLQQNYPNPFNPTTVIPYSMKESGHVRLQVYNIRGQLVRDLVNTSQAAGQYTVQWDGRDMGGQTVPTGTYLCTLETGNYRSFIKMTMAK